ncbi:DUF2946 family protein [Bradyrhizobium sp. dw_411]|uniref:DUF2946 family protein n=1 Tax=Bradyrhizobium sp. dw_411 TaxID=2720082 RepID=UPI001BCC086D|nr:DUF2946 family protein [Bradyrhizobium sp. dw_411]
MKWFRSNVQHGTRLALFALAVQFVLSFGHFHAIAAPAVSALQSAATQLDLSFASRLPAPQAVSKFTPQQPASDRDSDRQTDDFCAICAVVAMANAALSATPPALLLPHAVEFVYLTTDAGFVHLSPVRVAFQPRAPPAA